MRISDWSSDVCSSDLQGGCGVITLASPRHRKPMTHLIERLPRVRGEYRADAPVAQLTWFRVGGPAEILFRPANEADLIEFLAGCPGDVPVTVLGVGSNTLIRDGGLPGVVIRLGKAFATARAEGEQVIAGTGALDVTETGRAED